MASVINTNVASLIAQKNLFKSSGVLQTSIERLSSGLRINSARDDAAGLAISERMTSQIRGYEVARRNAGDGISLLQVADGALGTLSDNLQRMRELAIQAQNGTLQASDRANLDQEYQALSQEVARVIGVTFASGTDNGTATATGASFNGIQLLNTGTAVELQIGADNNDELSVSVGNLLTTFNTSIAAVGTAAVANDFDNTNLNSIDSAEQAVNGIDSFLSAVTSARAGVGAGINRLEAVINNLDTLSVNLSAARGRIIDADFARETAELTRAQILQQAGTAMLAQANQLPANVLALLG